MRKVQGLTDRGDATLRGKKVRGKKSGKKEARENLGNVIGSSIIRRGHPLLRGAKGSGESSKKKKVHCGGDVDILLSYSKGIQIPT